MLPARDSASLIFGRYAVLSRLAVGGMGEIFLARQVGVSGFERPVILKNLLPDLLEQEGSLEMFLDEARVAGRLNHPNVVSVYEVGEWQGIFYIAMEYIEGENLGRLARAASRTGTPLPPAVSAEVIRDAALGLDHAHHAVDAQGMPLELVHRDISPQNIMVRLDGLTKVVDFGVAKASNRSTRTRTGILKGKLRYMSPEQVRNTPLDGRSDQYALGVVLWELLTHRPLVESENPAEAMRRIALTPVPRPSSLGVEVPPMLEAIVMRMLAKPREQRFARCADVARALQAWLDEVPREAGQVSTTIDRLVGESVRARLKEPAEGLEGVLPRASGSSLSCPRCGQSTSGTSRFCPSCGSALTAPSPADAPAAPSGTSAVSESQLLGSGEELPTEHVAGARPAPPAFKHGEDTSPVDASAVVETQSQSLGDSEAAPTVRMRGRDDGAFKRRLVIVTVVVEGAEALRRHRARRRDWRRWGG